jgi:hypothetical protein
MHVAVVDLTATADEEDKEEEAGPSSGIRAPARTAPCVGTMPKTKQASSRPISQALAPSSHGMRTPQTSSDADGASADVASRQAVAEFVSEPFSCDALFACKFAQGPLPVPVSSLPVPYKEMRAPCGVLHATKEQARRMTGIDDVMSMVH